MASVITINRPDVVALAEKAATEFTGGNKTEAIAMALQTLFEQKGRMKSLFGAHPGSVWIAEGVDLTAPTFEDEEFDAETGREIDR